VNNIQVPNSSHISNTEEILRYLLDTHFPGNTPYGVSNSNANYEASDEDWQIATTIVTEERIGWAVAYFAPFKSRYRRNISCPFANRNRCNNRKTNKTTTGKYCIGYDGFWASYGR